MAATDAIVFPIKGQAYRIPCAFRDNQGNLLTGWTGASVTAYPDNGAGVSVTIAEAPASSGVGYIDIPAAQMTANMVLVKATVSNASATAFTAAIYPLILTEPTGSWDAQTQYRFENILLNMAAALLNQQTLTSSVNVISKRDGTQMLTGSYSETDTSAVRGKVS